MATRIMGGSRLTIQALDLGPRGHAAVEARYGAARRAFLGRVHGRERAASNLTAVAGMSGVVAVGVPVIAVTFLAIGAPLWLAVLVGAGTFVPLLFAWRRRPREVTVERHPARA